MSPARNESAAFRGRTVISRRGRPGLRLAAWRATWGVLRHCGVLAARHAAFTTRDQNRLADAQARTACAAALLRWIYALIIHGTTWNPQIAAGGQPPRRRPRHRSRRRVTRNHRRRRRSYQDFPPRRRASPSTRRGPTPLSTQGSSPGPARGPSPARLHAAGTPSPLQLRRAQAPRAGTAGPRPRPPGPGTREACPEPATPATTSTNSHLTNTPLRWC